MTVPANPAAESVAETLGAERLRDGASYAIDGVEPSAAVAPESIDEVCQVLDAAHRSGLAVSPLGGRTRLSLGNPPDRYDLALDLSRLDRIVDHNPADLTATVEAGITLAGLRRSLERHGQFLAMDAPRADLATVGGTLAAGPIGPLKWQFGSPRDLVVGMKVVQANGRVTRSGGRVVKNVSGYDMARLHIGGLGTLGVIVEVSFKLTPLPQRQATLLAGFAGSRQALAAGAAIAGSGVTPLAMVAFDSAACSLGGFADTGHEYYLAVRLGGRPRTLERQLDECRSLCGDRRGVSQETVDDTGTPPLWSGIADFGWRDEDGLVATARASLLPSRLADFVESLDASPLARAVVVEPGYGSGLVHWFENGEEDIVGAAVAAVAHARSAAARTGGVLVVERRPHSSGGKIDAWGEVGESIVVMRRMKEQYDPGRVLNPGRFVGGI